MTKSEKIKFAYLATYGGLLVLGMIVLGLFAKTAAGKGLVITVVSFAILGIIGFVILHNRITFYYCPKCKKQFRAKFLDTIIGSDRGNEGKRISCPNCDERDYYKVVRKFDK